MLNLEHLQVQFITNSVGERSAVILPIDQYYELIEDLEDLAITAERKDEPTIPHHQVIVELKADGLLPN